MSNIYSISPQTKSIDEASLWIAKLDKGLSEEDKVALDQWLGKSEQNRSALIRVGQIWDKAEALANLADLFPKPASRRPAEIYTAIAASVAAIALVVAISMAGFNPFSDQTPADQIENPEGFYMTAIGEQTNISLPDGTELMLNTNTSVRVNYSDNQRVLTLEQGELHVDVAHDESRPLSVLAGGQVVQAVGTAFNVYLRDQQKVDLVVTEGKVLVSQRDEIPRVSAPDGAIQMPTSAFSVSQGERVLLGQLEEKVEPIDFAEIEVQLSWREGNLVFRGEPLEEAVREIGRYTAAEFVFIDENLRQVKVAGLFETGDVDGLLAALSENFQIDSRRVDQRILLQSR
ncbi:MAG: hypothetical protein HOL48_01625 [Porticoccaceae bacterium]|nr:hypothetical protein [Porticoccaceae bacterium]